MQGEAWREVPGRGQRPPILLTSSWRLSRRGLCFAVSRISHREMGRDLPDGNPLFDRGFRRKGNPPRQDDSEQSPLASNSGRIDPHPSVFTVSSSSLDFLPSSLPSVPARKMPLARKGPLRCRDITDDSTWRRPRSPSHGRKLADLRPVLVDAAPTLLAPFPRRRMPRATSSTATPSRGTPPPSSCVSCCRTLYSLPRLSPPA